MTTISPIKYEVEIHDPLSTPVPMPPSILRREALVIWMFRIAMNAPIMAALTAIHVVMLARLRSAVARAGPALAAGNADIGADMTAFDMTRPSHDLGVDSLNAAVAASR